MKIYFAGPASHLRYVGDLLEDPAVNLLESIYSLNPQVEEWIKNHSNHRFMMDSGAFSWIQNTASRNKGVGPLLDKYIASINRTGCDYFFEMDLDCVFGIKEVEKFRHRIERETGKPTIPVWHKERGQDYFIQMCKDYDYVAVGSPLLRDNDRKRVLSTFPWFINKAHKYGAKIHALGMGSSNLLQQFPFDSADSTSWLQGGISSTIFRFNGYKMISMKNPSGMKTKYKPLTRHNLTEWIKFVKYMQAVGPGD